MQEAEQPGNSPAPTGGAGETTLEAQTLTKRYGEFVAVDGISFSLKRGDVLGFLGPNGAGKTTTMRMLTTYLPPTSGTVLVNGLDILQNANDVRRMIGYMPENPPIYEEMRTRQYLEFVARLRGLGKAEMNERVNYVLDAVHLRDRANSILGTLSKGYRQRVGLAQALLHDPDVLILDEPTAGLDPVQIREIRALIRGLAARHTILLSTHILSEVISICTRVLIINRGKVVHQADIRQGESTSDLEELFIRLTLSGEAETGTATTTEAAA